MLDPSGSWLERWAERGERLGAAHLRTPVTVHPHANPLALQSYALKRERQQVGTGAAHTDRCKAALGRRSSTAGVKRAGRQAGATCTPPACHPLRRRRHTRPAQPPTQSHFSSCTPLTAGAGVGGAQLCARALLAPL